MVAAWGFPSILTDHCTRCPPPPTISADFQPHPPSVAIPVLVPDPTFVPFPPPTPTCIQSHQHPHPRPHPHPHPLVLMYYPPNGVASAAWYDHGKVRPLPGQMPSGSRSIVRGLGKTTSHCRVEWVQRLRVRLSVKVGMNGSTANECNGLGKATINSRIYWVHSLQPTERVANIMGLAVYTQHNQNVRACRMHVQPNLGNQHPSSANMGPL